MILVAPAYSVENQLLSSIPCDAAEEPLSLLQNSVAVGCLVLNSFTFKFQCKRWFRNVSISLQWESRRGTLSKIKLSWLTNRFAAWRLGFCSADVLWLPIRVTRTHLDSCFHSDGVRICLAETAQCPTDLAQIGGCAKDSLERADEQDGRHTKIPLPSRTRLQALLCRLLGH